MLRALWAHEALAGTGGSPNGSAGSVRDRREHQRAFVWRGLSADPVRVGPRGFDDDTAFELTQTGLVSGESFNFDGDQASWVQDLATMEVTFFDLDSGPRGEDHGYARIRRINGTGAAAGQVERDLDELGNDAVGFAGPTAPMTNLTGSEEAVDAGAFGINDDGERVGYLGTEFLPEDPEFLIYDAMKWNVDGSRTELVSPAGLDAVARSIKNDGSASGFMLVGAAPETSHMEAAYWPTPDVNVGLGALPGGGYSDAFGMDEGGWLVGMMDRAVADPERNRFDEDGYIAHSFLWSPRTPEGKVRILPSLYGARKDLGWRKWVGSAVHAVNRDLNQAASGSHWRFRDQRLVSAPTVYLNADQCGREVATTHDPFGLEGAPRLAPGDRREWPGVADFEDLVRSAR